MFTLNNSCFLQSFNLIYFIQLYSFYKYIFYIFKYNIIRHFDKEHLISFYPFLKKIWTRYNDFDKKVEDDKNFYDNLCNFILNGPSVELSKYKDFCMKLMRNLGRFSSDPKNYELTHERCNILYNWIYNSIGKKRTTDDIVNKCFKEYTEYMVSVKNMKRCYKISYDENFKEPIKITLLDIFDNNTPDIINALNDANDSISIPGKKFVCECVRIYKNMYETYCLKNRLESETNRTTCEQLDIFKESYGLFLTKLQGLDHKIPLLIDIDNELLAKCSKDESKLQFNSRSTSKYRSYFRKQKVSNCWACR
ncbi:hypothetical protein PVMG_04550 [Plasmodium vivax Mauritania I]|uniref:Variable surface protein n=1 Tax=Plasmodium vivax Mauritania I TaxID=1035515 RepID=A0A0J9T2T0_PLAVI|nr:hypothetical protein PVMG_04550 [Plasmodium vivax Mauritania I]